MRWWLVVGSLGLVAALGCGERRPRTAPPPEAQAHPAQPVYTGRLLVRLKEPVTREAKAALVAEMQSDLKGSGPNEKTLLVEPKPGAAEEALAFSDPRISYIEPEVIYTSMEEAHARTPMGSVHEVMEDPAHPKQRGLFGAGDDISATSAGFLTPLAAPAPNDPYFRYQWGMQTYPYGIDLLDARELATGTGVLVAVCDSGIRRDLPDLAETTILPGRSTLEGSDQTTDQNGHGTHVTGTIAQSTDNRLGCSGVAPRARVLPVRVLDANGRGSNFSIATGIEWAVAQGAQVINLSVGGGPSRALQEAVAAATRKGVILVAAAGNAGVSGLTYPAAYPNVVAVGAIDRTGRRANFSQYGKGLALVAPGVSVLQQTINRSTGQIGYYYLSGTSMAAPHVTGVAALLLSRKKGLTPADVTRVLTATAHDLGQNGPDSQYGAGTVDAFASLQRLGGGSPGPEPQPVPSPKPDTTPLPQPEPPATGELARLVQLFNFERAKERRGPVTLEGRLTQAALGHATEMATRGILTHTSADGRGAGARITAAGYPWRTWGEIVASGQPTPESVVDAWMNSPPHRGVILGSAYSEVGIAVARGASGRPYWCADFGHR